MKTKGVPCRSSSKQELAEEWFNEHYTSYTEEQGYSLRAEDLTCAAYLAGDANGYERCRALVLGLLEAYRTDRHICGLTVKGALYQLREEMRLLEEGSK